MKAVEEVVEIPLSKLSRHPDNPRKARSYGKSSIAPLAEAIGQNGVSPLIVRPLDDGFQILAGHRREAALESDGAKTAPCVVRDMDDFRALMMVGSDNAQHEAPDPFLEARLVEKAFLVSKDATETSIAAGLGWSRQKVARRRQLLNLAPSILQEYQNGESAISRWPVTWLECVVQLDAAAQESWWKQPRTDAFMFTTLEDVETSVQGWLRELGKAPWSLTDAALLPKAGACVDCKSNSANTPGLFAVVKGEDPKAGRCRLLECWEAKLAKSTAQKVAAALKEDPDLVFLRGAQFVADGQDVVKGKPPKGVEALDQYAWTPSAKGVKGARQGIVGIGAGAGKKVWYKPTGSPDANGNGPMRAPSLKDRLERAEAAHKVARAAELAATAIRELQDAKAVPEDRDVLALAHVVGIDSAGWKGAAADHAEALKAVDEGNWPALVWPGVRDGAVNMLNQRWGAEPDEVRAIARICLCAVMDGTEAVQVEERSDESVPVPQDLLALRDEAAAKPAKKGGKKNAPKTDSGEEPAAVVDGTEGGEG